MNRKRTKIKTLADLPLDERRKRLEIVAEHAAHEYETDKELTAFTDMDGLFGTGLTERVIKKIRG